MEFEPNDASESIGPRLGERQVSSVCLGLLPWQYQKVMNQVSLTDSSFTCGYVSVSACAIQATTDRVLNRVGTRGGVNPGLPVDFLASRSEWIPHLLGAME